MVHDCVRTPGLRKHTSHLLKSVMARFSSVDSSSPTADTRNGCSSPRPLRAPSCPGAMTKPSSLEHPRVTIRPTWFRHEAIRRAVPGCPSFKRTSFSPPRTKGDQRQYCHFREKRPELDTHFTLASNCHHTSLLLAPD